MARHTAPEQPWFGYAVEACPAGCSSLPFGRSALLSKCPLPFGRSALWECESSRLRAKVLVRPVCATALSQGSGNTGGGRRPCHVHGNIINTDQTPPLVRGPDSEGTRFCLCGVMREVLLWPVRCWRRPTLPVGFVTMGGQQVLQYPGLMPACLDHMPTLQRCVPGVGFPRVPVELHQDGGPCGHVSAKGGSREQAAQNSLHAIALHCTLTAPASTIGRVHFTTPTLLPDDPNSGCVASHCPGTLSISH
ncbi:hypothetical protein HaLaN_02123 [Haematococcus lacustris]|uniref:Uncharacterized protein n=1 Tax=Haematococcus lacustris TaxID=44745 RepID=A0A699YK39_HAELA|nr:hypothetical protein HaLaN_02123 [Haematococcus lacustris]